MSLSVKKFNQDNHSSIREAYIGNNAFKNYSRQLIEKVTTEEQRKFVDGYVKAASIATELERLSDDREKTGVFTGAYAVNPLNGETIPVWAANFVLMDMQEIQLIVVLKL